MLEFGKKESTIKYQDRPGAYGITIKNELVLIVNTPRGYFLPGGGLDENEEPEIALAREYLEELGIKIKPLKKIGMAAQYCRTAVENIYFKKIGHFYLVDHIDKIPQASEADHSPEWVTAQFAIKNLRQEFQSWAIEEVLIHFPANSTPIDEKHS